MLAKLCLNFKKFKNTENTVEKGNFKNCIVLPVFLFSKMRVNCRWVELCVMGAFPGQDRRDGRRVTGAGWVTDHDTFHLVSSRNPPPPSTTSRTRTHTRVTVRGGGRLPACSHYVLHVSGCAVSTY